MKTQDIVWITGTTVQVTLTRKEVEALNEHLPQSDRDDLTELDRHVINTFAQIEETFRRRF